MTYLYILNIVILLVILAREIIKLNNRRANKKLLDQVGKVQATYWQFK